MKSLLFAFAILSAAFTGYAQENALDEYIADAGTIVIAKCMSIGPVNILMRANTRVQTLHVVKGKETLRELTVDSAYEMSPGQAYLLKTQGKASEGDRYFRTDTRDAVIPFTEVANLEQIKLLSPRIVVLRTMNLRADRLESKIRSLQYELDAINVIRKGN